MLIDIKKNWKTKSGKKVINIQYVPKNSCGDLVTFPIKGSVVIKEKPLKLEYNIWMANGQFDIFDPHHGYNLVEATDA